MVVHMVHCVARLIAKGSGVDGNEAEKQLHLAVSGLSSSVPPQP